MRAKFYFSLAVLIVAGLLLSACAGQPASEQGFGTEEFLAALRDKGVDAEKGDQVEQAFFSVVGSYVNINDDSVQVFEYETAETMESDAVLVDASGGSIGNSMVSWIATPHFYKKGRILVLYVGDNAKTIQILESVLGSQFAGG
jgi:hypothetical protein